MEIKIKAAPRWWGEGEPPVCIAFHGATVAYVDDHFVLSAANAEASGVTRDQMVEELPVDESEKHSGKPVSTPSKGDARRVRKSGVSEPDPDSES